MAPNLDPAVVTACQDAGLLAIPGVLTPTEIVTASRLGLSLLKLFPCGGLGPRFLSALRGPFPSIGFVPTGGIELTDVAGWFRAGAVAVGLGSCLTGRDDPADPADPAESLAQRVLEIRKQVPL